MRLNKYNNVQIFCGSLIIKILKNVIDTYITKQTLNKFIEKHAYSIGWQELYLWNLKSISN
ncbi:hypothetical protein HHS_04270 [Candidatus Pantoea carbekii]|uniref:Uncharacterized protein n=1 Tax=Candidatus Pantoea carbekii TaxID=1235990 RepID=U3U7K8_9GAMM|nr:hypothetical protein HHS_04270 [Candidatus Pantoea carbekii]